MLLRLRALPVLALLFGALDTLWVRSQFDHRPLDVALFAQASLLWLAFGLIALVPASFFAWLSRRRTRRRGLVKEERALPAAIGLAVWMSLPVAVHACIDRYTDLGGDTSQLRSARPWLEVAAIVVGIVGLAFVLRRLLARTSGARVAAVVALVALAAGLGLSFHRSPARADVASAASSDRPNVLMLVWDTTRAASIELYGYDRDTTPHLAKLAASSLVFSEARSVSSYTLTSHLSMLTGVYPSHHGARMTRQRFDPIATPPVAADFHERGYRTAAFVGTGVLRAQTGAAYGFETFDDLVDPPVCDTLAWALVHDVQAVLASKVAALRGNGLPHWIQDFQRPASEVLAHAARWIRSDDPRPWFCMINLYDVHWPYLPPLDAQDKWVGAYDGPIDGYLKRSDRFVEGYKINAQDDHHLSELYDAELWDLDREVDQFFAQLDLERTALVLTSDHGEALGEGGRYEHADILECQVRVPLLVRPAGGTDGRRVEARASGVDVAPTLLALAGIDASEHARSGKNLLALANEPAAPRPLLVEDRDHIDRTDVRYAYYDENWKLVKLGLGEHARYELYDLASDPLGLTDVEKEHEDVVERLSHEMADYRAAWKVDDKRDVRGGELSNTDALKALGYVEGAATKPPPPEPPAQ